MANNGNSTRNLVWSIIGAVILGVLGLVSYFIAMGMNVIQVEGATNLFQTGSHLLWGAAVLLLAWAVLAPIVRGIFNARKVPEVSLQDQYLMAQIRNVDADTGVRMATARDIYSGTARQNDSYNRDFIGQDGMVMDDLNRRSVHRVRQDQVNQMKATGQVPYTPEDLGTAQHTLINGEARPTQPGNTFGGKPTGNFFEKFAPKGNDSEYIPGSSVYEPPMDTRVMPDIEDISNQPTEYMPGMGDTTDTVPTQRRI